MVRKPPSEAFVMMCLRYMSYGEISRSHGGVWVRKQGSRQARADAEMKVIIARDWMREEVTVTDRGREIVLARPNEAGAAALAAHIAARQSAVEVSTVEVSSDGQR